MIPMEIFKQTSERFGIQIETAVLGKFDEYAQFLVSYNEKVNLTAITDPTDIVYKHFIDSLLPLRVIPAEKPIKLIDVGTGAGFPGVPLKLVRPDIELTLLDSLQKRITFLQQLSQRLDVPFEAIHGRAEDAAHEPALRAAFDVAAARAVAALPVLCEYCLPFLKQGGIFFAMKAKGAHDELEQSAHALELLGGAFQEVIETELPDGSARTILVIKKISQTPTKYPRPAAKIAKKML